MVSIIIISCLSFVILFVEKVHPYQKLYAYQIAKLQNDLSSIDLIFIGDSSLGNALNVNLFNSLSRFKALNLSLTGSYGFAGNYNLLKKVIKKNSHIKKIIIVQTIDMMAREISYLGYLYTIEFISDFTELSFKDKKKLIETCMNSFFSIDHLSRYISHHSKMDQTKIEKDYIKQNSPITVDTHQTPLRIRINKEKSKFLKKIVHLCHQHHIRLIYMHGPYLDILDKQSMKDIALINKHIQETGIDLIPGIPFMSKQKIGDKIDHVHPDYKNEMTLRIYQMLEEHDKKFECIPSQDILRTKSEPKISTCAIIMKTKHYTFFKKIKK
jgi:predicted metallopeptidase